MARTLDQWLEYQLHTHPQGIALGLERVREVARRMDLLRLPCPVISVAGTNGKGSTVAFIEAIAAASGYRVGAFTSPHFLRYNERIRIGGAEVSDADLVRAFEAIDAARADIPLTYFEFGTLAALRLFADAGLPRRTPPDAQRDCQVQAAIDTREAPRITSPLTQVTYSLRLSQPQESITLAAHAAADARLLYWFADHTLVGQGSPQTALQWRPERSGQYRIRVSDDQGRSTSRALQVEFLP